MDSGYVATQEPMSAVSHYNELFSHGYHSDWSELQLRWLDALIPKVPLPAVGRALDFGCGSGFLTAHLAKLLPGWEVSGVDISDVAIRDARHHHPRGSFFVFDEWKESKERYDFIFSHHVLEHVPCLHETLADLSQHMVKSTGKMLHIFPCDSACCIEHWMVSKIRGGIESDHEGRHFFEEVGHLRRITSASLQKAVSTANVDVEVQDEWYAGHTVAALEWMTSAPPWALARMLNPLKAVGVSAALPWLLCLFRFWH